MAILSASCIPQDDPHWPLPDFWILGNHFAPIMQLAKVPIFIKGSINFLGGEKKVQEKYLLQYSGYISIPNPIKKPRSQERPRFSLQKFSQAILRRLSPASLRSQSSLLGQFAPSRTIFFAHEREFFRVQVKPSIVLFRR
jgi:hypothetical protein